jgi:exopolysaccharide biosynthesis polyprenyl glycosylphosphotransferase
MVAQTNRMLLAAALDVALTLLSLRLSTEARLLLPFGKDLNEPTVQLNALVYVITALIWVTVFSQFSLYTRRRARFRDEWWILAFAVLLALLILAGLLYLSFRQMSRLQFLYFGSIDLALLSSAHLVRHIARTQIGAQERWRVLIAGDGPVGRDLAERLANHRAAGVNVIGFLTDNPDQRGAVIDGVEILATLDEATDVIQRERVSEIVLALPREAHDWMLEVIASLEALPVQVSLVPDVLDLAWFMTRVDDLYGVPLLRLRESPLNGPARAVKRLIDIAVSSVALLISAPLVLLAALWVRLDSPGPAFIRQIRVGENAQPFQMLKLRTMYAGAETATPPSPLTPQEAADADSAHKRRDDPRVTRAGRVLRRYSIDELPQLANVLRGDMSLVGPRPELPWLVECYAPWQRHRFAVPPGMTGWWQVNGRSDRPMHLNVEDDLYYIRNFSIWLDVVILLRTLPVVLSGRGAY